MKLQKREKILLGTAAGLVVAAGLGVFIMLGDPRADDFLEKERDRLQVELQKRENAMRADAEDARRMAAWQKRSLPSDPVLARSLYQNWLRVLCDKAGLHGLDVHSEETESHQDIYKPIRFSIRAHANLEELCSFLYGFYSAGHLQQIRRLELKPMQNSRDLDVLIGIEALSLSDAASRDKLTAEAGHSLKLPHVSDYRTAIAGRNFFAPYVPPPPPAPPPRTITARSTPRRESPPPFDFAKFAVVTGFTEVDGTERVWLQDRIAGRGKTLQLKEGDRFQVGGVAGRVRKIAPEGEVIVEFDGKIRALRAGQDLREGRELKESPP